MALSNIFVEPRREITETVIGFATIIGIIALTFVLPIFLQNWSPIYAVKPDDTPYGLGLFIWWLFCLLGYTVGLPLIIFIHAIGDVVCDAFQRRGVYLRPRQRYKRNHNGEIVPTGIEGRLR